MQIILIGLGCEKGGLSVAALNEIKNAKKVFVRSLVPQSTLVLAENGIEAQSFDELFEKSRGFDSLNKKIASAVLAFAKNSVEQEGTVVYCMDGSVAEDNAAALILKRAKNVRVLEAASRSLKLAAEYSFRGGYTSVSAHSAELITSACVLPLIVYDIDDAFLAAELKLKLCDLFGDEAPAILISGGKKKKIKLFELDRFCDYSYNTALLIERRELCEKERFSLEDLLQILYVLRSENGCPWDRAQTRESIALNLIEECYELYDALLSGDELAIAEESGDVLLQVAFHMVFGEEAHEYNRSDVISGVCEKLIERHTHVFGTDKASGGEEALEVWEKNKAKEKGFATAGEYLQSVPKSFPAAMRAQKLQKRAAKFGFDFSSLGQVYDKIAEECEEVKSAKTQEQRQAEVGDLLFSAVNLARLTGADAEQVLNASSDKFLNRFIETEKLCLADGKTPEKLTEKEWDDYYNAAKKCKNR